MWSRAAYYSFERQAYRLTGEDLTVENLNSIYCQVAQDFGFDSVGCTRRSGPV